MIPVGPVATVVAFLEHEEGDVSHHAGVVTPGKGELADGLLGEDGVHVILQRCAHVAGGCKTQPVSAADCRFPVSKGHGRREWEHFMKTLGILRGEIRFEQVQTLHLACRAVEHAWEGGRGSKVQVLFQTLGGDKIQHGIADLEGTSVDPGLAVHDPGRPFLPGCIETVPVRLVEPRRNEQTCSVFHKLLCSSLAPYLHT